MAPRMVTSTFDLSTESKGIYTPPDLHPQIYGAGTPKSWSFGSNVFTDFNLKRFQRSWTPKKIDISTSQPVASCQTLWLQKMVARWCHRAHITKMTMIIQGKMSKNKNRKSFHLKDAWHNDISNTVNNLYQVIFLWNFCSSSLDSFLFQVPHAFWWEAWAEAHRGNTCTCVSSFFF